MALISIIVPIYKVEKYLNKCIDSILAQTFTDFELILVDDGSPDNCGEICDVYADQDERIVVSHKENGGLSSARNAGLEIASGRYIGFIDSDDWIEPDMYKILHENIRMSDADIAICGIRRISEKTGKMIECTKCCKDTTLDQRGAFSMIFGRDDTINVFVWNKLYKKEVFNEIRYPEGVVYEDVYRISDILLKCSKIHITTQPLYNYLKREGSITGSGDVESKISRLNAAVRNYEIISEKYPEFIDNIKGRVCNSRYFVLDNMVISGKTDIGEHEEIMTELKREFRYVMKNKNITLRRKISAICLRISFKLYMICVKLQYRNR